MDNIGIDIIEIKRIESAIKKNSRFLDKVYTEYEKNYIKSKGKNYYRTAAGIFSAKEAVSKSIGTGIKEITWKDIKLYYDENGAPKVKPIVLEDSIYSFEISISHNQETAMAVSICKYKKSYVKLFKKRDLDTHKGDFGKIGLIGGSSGMTGSICLSSMGALRTGSGLVYTIVPRKIENIIENKSLENIIIPIEDCGHGYFIENIENNAIEKIKELDVLGIGPGIGRNEETKKFLKNILSLFSKNILVDADGIKLLSELKTILKTNRKVVITPHIHEFSIFTGETIDYINRNKEELTMKYAKKYNLIVVLKGHRTLVTDGIDIYYNKSGNPGMATAGSGDVLTGIITSLMAQGFAPFEAAKQGAYLHGVAGDLASEDKGEYGMIARDIVEKIPYAIKKLS